MKKNQNDRYYDYTRTEILPLLPEKIDRVLEIGCATGNTLMWLKSLKECKWVGGVELNYETAQIAKNRVDACYVGDIESIDLPIASKSLDLILCLDVLEHLENPWQAVKRLHDFLKPDGVIISSIPNVLHYSVLCPLIFRGEFNYAEAGILDKTHLRFFEKKSSLALMENSGLKVDAIQARVRGNDVIKIFVLKLLPYFIKKFIIYQYIIRARRIE
ncbi:MAG: hypothetical protein A2176_10490 [Spirochaetes bacterium RBG_13_51_14]|nr:MAG: hypothetical protein A2176_10490 [Spirochaetes bacterium RBG_13_51_14]